jgi:hypothetical protein
MIANCPATSTTVVRMKQILALLIAILLLGPGAGRC